MMRTIYKVEGIHCSSCEILIEEKLSGVKGVKKVEIDLAEKKVIIDSDFEIDLKKLNKLFKGSGYKFLEINDIQKKEKNKWWWMPAISIIIVFLFLSKTGVANFLNINSQSSLLTFLILGIIAGVSSCGALLSGIIMTYKEKVIQVLVGRLVGYAILGTVLGGLGQGLAIGGFSNLLIILMSIVMVVVALQMMEIKWAQKIKLNLPKTVSKKIIDKKMPLIIGLLTVFLPCGFTLLSESVVVMSGNWVSGTMIMSAFVAGSSIPLFLIGWSSEKFIKNQKVIGLLILFFVIYNLNFQFGWIKSPYYPPLRKGGSENTSTENIQIVKASYTRFGGLDPYTITVKKGQKVRIEIEVKENEYGCMSTIMLPGLFNRAQTLTAGKILIMEFTPEKVGTYKFTCAMGVPHKGEVNVTE